VLRLIVCDLPGPLPCRDCISSQTCMPPNSDHRDASTIRPRCCVPPEGVPCFMPAELLICAAHPLRYRSALASASGISFVVCGCARSPILIHASIAPHRRSSRCAFHQQVCVSTCSTDTEALICATRPLRCPSALVSASIILFVTCECARSPIPMRASIALHGQSTRCCVPPADVCERHDSPTQNCRYAPRGRCPAVAQLHQLQACYL
jgi:hypothetical protein